MVLGGAVLSGSLHKAARDKKSDEVILFRGF